MTCGLRCIAYFPYAFFLFFVKVPFLLKCLLRIRVVLFRMLLLFPCLYSTRKIVLISIRVTFRVNTVSAVAGEFCLLLWSSLSCLLGFLKRSFIKLFGVIRLLILFNNIRFSFPAVLFGFYWFKCLFYFAYFFCIQRFCHFDSYLERKAESLTWRMGLQFKI